MGTDLPADHAVPETGAPAGPRFQVRPVEAIDGQPAAQRWLIEGLWALGGVGFLGGTPKTGKTWLNLELAVCVASGSPALGVFEVREPGPVLAYMAEDGSAATRDRIAMLCKSKGLTMAGLPLFLLEADRVRLDDQKHRAEFERALEEVRPKLVILDPLVRLHDGSENNVQHVTELLGYLRLVQRRYQVGILVTHHYGKARGKAARVEPGLGLRGSSDLWAWGDCNLYLSRLEGGLVEMRIEQRQAASPEEPTFYRLKTDAESAALEICDAPEEEPPAIRPTARAPERTTRSQAAPLSTRIVELLKAEGRPLSQAALRKALGGRFQTYTQTLRGLEEQGVLKYDGKGWWLSQEAKPPE